MPGVDLRYGLGSAPTPGGVVNPSAEQPRTLEDCAAHQNFTNIFVNGQIGAIFVVMVIAIE